MSLSLREAKTQSRCRICEEPIINRGAPEGWHDDYREQIFPVPLVLNFGQEFAHKQCLENYKPAIQQPSTPQTK